uniref:Uncharacterized protein n=1 Tax=Ascaris lumbricoides TaxID=6252 RepID=A0A0M3IWV8_ASCLU
LKSEGPIWRHSWSTNESKVLSNNIFWSRTREEINVKNSADGTIDDVRSWTCRYFLFTNLRITV